MEGTRRQSIRMQVDEVARFLEGRHTATVASHGPDGHIHAVAMWYTPWQPSIGFWTFARSQKSLNLRRDDRITVLVSDGERYDDLRGVQIVGRAHEVTDPATTLDIGRSVLLRYTTLEQAPADLGRLARGRVAFVVEPLRWVSWDHRKLHGRY